MNIDHWLDQKTTTLKDKTGIQFLTACQDWLNHRSGSTDNNGITMTQKQCQEILWLLGDLVTVLRNLLTTLGTNDTESIEEAITTGWKLLEDIPHDNP